MNAWIMVAANRQAFILLLNLIGHELAGRREEGSHQVESNYRQDEVVNLEQRQAGLHTELGEGALSGQQLSDDGGRDPKHGHTSNEQLVRLGEAG